MLDLKWEFLYPDCFHSHRQLTCLPAKLSVMCFPEQGLTFDTVCAFKAHIWDTCLYIICECVLRCVRKTLFSDIQAYTSTHTHTHTNTHNHTHWAIPDRLHMKPLSNSISIRYFTQWTHADRSNATQLIPPVQQKAYYCWPWTCVAALSERSSALWRAYRVSYS